LTGVVLQVIQSAVVLTLAPLYTGFIGRCEAIVESKRGPSIFQPYRDIAKQLRKESAISENATWVFRAAPVVAFSCYLAVSAIVPIITDEPLPLAFLGDLIGGAFILMLASFSITLAAMDTGSPVGGLGASRTAWVGSLAEPSLILVFFTVAALSNSDNPYLENHAIASSLSVYTLPTHLLGLVAFFMIVLAENGRIPIDSHGGSTEISMIEESRVLEYSGREYALVKWGSWMKLFLMSAIFMNVFVVPWGLGHADSILGGLQGIGALLGKLVVCGIVIVIIDTSFAKLRFFRIAEYLGGSFLLALIGIVTGYVVRK
jgi:formate hydrogenlyase subunit 4